jgi:hypothetical protein
MFNGCSSSFYREEICGLRQFIKNLKSGGIVGILAIGKMVGESRASLAVHAENNRGAASFIGNAGAPPETYEQSIPSELRLAAIDI